MMNSELKMNNTYIPKQSQNETEWSGGSTTQLFIYPEDAIYGQRNFLFRISSAKVKDDESVFTKLPGVSRVIMILDGELRIEHEGASAKVLKKFDTDVFQGDWNTKGFGVCTDFNLMTTGDCSGNLHNVILNPNQIFTKAFTKNQDFIGYYLLKGKVEIVFTNQKVELNQNGFILMKRENTTEEFKINANEYAELVEVEIYL